MGLGYEVIKKLQDKGYPTLFYSSTACDRLLGRTPCRYHLLTAAPLPIILEVSSSTRSELEFADSHALLRRGRNQVFVEKYCGDFRSLQDFAAKHASSTTLTSEPLYFDSISCELYDPLNVKPFLECRQLTTVLSPQEILRREPAIILDAINAAAHNKLFIHPNLAEAIRQHRQMAALLSGPRLAWLLEDLLRSNNPNIGLDLLKDLGLLEIIFPELWKMSEPEISGSYHLWRHVKATVCALTNRDSCSFGLLLAALYHDVGKPAVKQQGLDGRFHFMGHDQTGAEIFLNTAKRLALPSSVASEAQVLIANHMVMHHHDTLSLGSRRMLISNPFFRNMLALLEADIQGTQSPGSLARKRGRKEAWIREIALWNEAPAIQRRYASPLVNARLLAELEVTDPGLRTFLVNQGRQAQYEGLISSQSEARAFVLTELERELVRP